MPRYFTVEEANSVVQLIRPLVGRVLEIREAILLKQPELESVLNKAIGNGGSQVASEAALEFNTMSELIRQIQATGAEVKDINTGLIDFLALREGREVYLCWRYGEGQLEYWHDLDAGFAGRQPI